MMDNNLVTTIYAEVAMLTDRQLRRLSVIRVDSATQTLRLSIHLYDKMRLDMGDEIEESGVSAMGIERVPDVVCAYELRGVDQVYAELAELPKEWVGTLDVAKFTYKSGEWAILAKTHAGSDAERFAWLYSK